MSRETVTMAAPPVPPLNMEEVRFWLDIMQEHALFIKLGLPFDQTELIKEADAFYRDFGALKDKANRVTSEKKFAELVTEASDVIIEFHSFKRHLLRMQLLGRLGGTNTPLFLDHMAREAEYVLALFSKIRTAKLGAFHQGRTRENVFWLRIMADHTKFISDRLDPSERAIIHTVDAFSNEFDDLFLQANDLHTMLIHRRLEPLRNEEKKGKKRAKHSNYQPVTAQIITAPVYNRFIQDARTATIRLRDFKRALHKLVVENRVASILPALLADHVRREADHYLLVLAMMDKGIIGHDADYEEEYADILMVEEDTPVVTAGLVNETIAIKEETCHNDCSMGDDDLDDLDDDDLDEDDMDEDDDGIYDDEDDYDDIDYRPQETNKYVKPKFLPIGDDEEGIHEPVVHQAPPVKPVVAEKPAISANFAPSPPSTVTTPSVPGKAAELPKQKPAQGETKHKWGNWPRPLGSKNEKK